MISSAPDADDLLKQGIAAVRAGRKDEARQKLLLVVELDEQNEQGWLWLSGVRTARLTYPLRRTPGASQNPNRVH